MSRKDVQSQIDDEVSTYEQRIQELKTRRNTYAYISMLPPELLVEIFLLVQERSYRLKYWHQISHVCRHWRHAAVAAPILWTEPPTRHQNLNYTNLMLERSKTANLNISLERRVTTATITSISNHIERIKTLKMVLCPDEMGGVCDRLIASGHMFSRLKSLDIEHFGFQTTVDWTHPLPSTFIRRSSSLRSLSLKKVAFDWQIPAPFNLESLHLLHVGLTEKISCNTFLDTLRHMPRLQHLAFTFADLLLPHDAPTSQASAVVLPHLQSLDATDCNPPHIPYLLSHLVLPRLNSLKIDASPVRDGKIYCSSNALATITTTIANGDFPVNGSLHVGTSGIGISALDHVFVNIRLWQVKTEDHDIRFTQQFSRQIAPIFPGISLNSDKLVQPFGNMVQLKAITISH